MLTFFRAGGHATASGLLARRALYSPVNVQTLPVLRITRRVPADDAFIAALGRAAFSEYSRDAARHTANMAAHALTLVARDAAGPIGFAVLERPTRDCVYVSAIAVVETERGRGVGRALMREVERQALRWDARRVRLATADSNLAALDLFLRLGFRRVQGEGFTYTRGQRAIALEKRLHSPV